MSAFICGDWVFDFQKGGCGPLIRVISDGAAVRSQDTGLVALLSTSLMLQ
jgi:hypothetical protein